MSFSTRLWLSAIAVWIVVALVSSSEGVLATVVDRAEQLDDQNRAVVRAATRVFDDLQDAETAQRGYLLTDQINYLQPYETARARVGGDLGQLAGTLRNAPEVQSFMPDLQHVVGSEFAELGETIALERSGRHAAAIALVRSGRGTAAMTTARNLIGTMSDVEIGLQAEHERAAQELERAIFWLVMVGGPVVTLLLLAFTWSLVRKLRDSFAWLRDRIAAIRSGETQSQTLHGNDELTPVAAEFDALAQELRLERVRRSRTEDDLRRTNDELTARHQTLHERAELSELRRRLANRLSGCLTLIECLEVIRQLLPSAVRDVPGVFYTLDNSRRFFTTIMRWHGASARDDEFAPDECWAVRRGRPHQVVDTSHDIVCAHVGEGLTGGYTCTPLAAHGEMLGLLYLESAQPEDVAEDELQILGEMLAIALANVRLRESLQMASLRDALTGLFNRRYLQEAWALESARALRAGRSIALLMLDIDHFKRFNDTYGHIAGDQVLKSVAEALRKGTRTGDVVCRYGGEEFVVVLIEADDQSAFARAEALRRAVKVLSPSYGAQQLPSVTISIGVATFPLAGSTFDEVQQAADIALYRAKAAGRDRVELATLGPALEPPPEPVEAGSP